MSSGAAGGPLPCRTRQGVPGGAPLPIHSGVAPLPNAAGRDPMSLGPPNRRCPELRDKTCVLRVNARNSCVNPQHVGFLRPSEPPAVAGPAGAGRAGARRQCDQGCGLRTSRSGAVGTLRAGLRLRSQGGCSLRQDRSLGTPNGPTLSLRMRQPICNRSDSFAFWRLKPSGVAMSPVRVLVFMALVGDAYRIWVGIFARHHSVLRR